MSYIVIGRDTPAYLNDPVDPGLPHSGTDPGLPGATGAGVRQWMLGAWWTDNYPACVHFYEDRLCFAGAPQSPDRIDMSNTTAYELFSPSSLADNTVVDSNACAFALNSNTCNAIKWLQSDQNGLIAGTQGGEWIISSASISSSISPTSVIAKPTTEFGACQIPPLHTGITTLFVQADTRKVRELRYNFMMNGFMGNLITPLAEHASVGGFAYWDMQRTPQQILWLVRNDGSLVSVSYDADQNEVAWAVHELAGQDAKVLSLAVIPSPDGTRDEVWLAVSRTINGATAVYIERMSKLWEVGDQVSDTEDGVTFNRYVPSLTAYADSAQRLVSESEVTSVSGLTWLIGQTVGVLGDGSVQPDAVVDGTGTIQLASPAKDVVVGLRYPSYAQTLPIEAGGADGPAQGKTKRIHRVIFSVYESSGFQTVADPVLGPITDIPTRLTSDLMDEPTPLTTGDIVVSWEGTYDRLGQVQWQQQYMVPLNISALVVQLETQDGG